MAISQMSAVQCRLAPLIQVIQDCSHLYHYAVKLMFKLHSCESLGMGPVLVFSRVRLLAGFSGIRLAWMYASIAMSPYPSWALRTRSIPRRHPR